MRDIFVQRAAKEDDVLSGGGVRLCPDGMTTQAWWVTEREALRVAFEIITAAIQDRRHG